MKRIILYILTSMLLCSCIYEDLSNCPNYNQESRDSVKTKSVIVEPIAGCNYSSRDSETDDTKPITLEAE